MDSHVPFPVCTPATKDTQDESHSRPSSDEAQYGTALLTARDGGNEARPVSGEIKATENNGDNDLTIGAIRKRAKLIKKANLTVEDVKFLSRALPVLERKANVEDLRLIAGKCKIRHYKSMSKDNLSAKIKAFVDEKLRVVMEGGEHSSLQVLTAPATASGPAQKKRKAETGVIPEEAGNVSRSRVKSGAMPEETESVSHSRSKLIDTERRLLELQMKQMKDKALKDERNMQEMKHEKKEARLKAERDRLFDRLEVKMVSMTEENAKDNPSQDRIDLLKEQIEIMKDELKQIRTKLASTTY